MINVSKRKANAFSILELITVTAIVAMLAAIAIPNYLSNRQRALITAVKENMHVVQIASEQYSVDSGGSYGPASADLAPFVSGGTASRNGINGVFPTNPFTNVMNEMPAACIVNNVMWIPLLRTTVGTDNFGGAGGQVAYDGIQDNLSSSIYDSYAVTGNADNSSTMASIDGYMILSNE